MVVCIGEALVDLIDGVAYPGGCPFNASLAASRLGVPVLLLDRISRDEYGKKISEKLVADSIQVPPSYKDDPRPTMYSKVVLDERGQAKYLFKTEGTATLGLDADSLLEELEKAEGVEAILIGSVAIMLEPAASAIKRAVTEYKKHHPQVTVFLDPNVRPTLITDKNAYRKWMRGIIALADMIKMSDEDLAFLMDMPFEKGVREIRKINPCELVITRGAKGSEWHRLDKVFKAPAADVKIIDTVGAGDTFNGALLRGIHALGKPAGDFTDAECQETLILAAHAADINCTRRGCDPPTAKELGL